MTIPIFNMQKRLEYGHDQAPSYARNLFIGMAFAAGWTEAPELQRAAVEYKDKLVIIGVNMTTNDTRAQVPAFVEEYGLTFPIVLDETGEVSQAYQVIGLPTSIFIDQNGMVTDVCLGPVNQAYIESKLTGG